MPFTTHSHKKTLSCIGHLFSPKDYMHSFSCYNSRCLSCHPLKCDPFSFFCVEGHLHGFVVGGDWSQCAKPLHTQYDVCI
jgi:hypothetical protein